MIMLRFLTGVAHQPGRTAGAGRCRWLFTAVGLMLSSIFLASCTGLLGNSSPARTPTPTPSKLALTKLHWCGKPSMVFRDEGAPVTVTASATATTIPSATATAGSTPTASVTASATSTATASPTASGPRTISDWSQVEPNLGFMVYLPATLPPGTCLVSAQATIHDPIFGGNFFIGYLLPNHNSISLSEAPLNGRNAQFQCNPSGSASPQKQTTPKSGTPVPSASPTQAPNQLCSGARNTTNIVLLAQGSMDSLQKFFNALQPDVAWIPAS
jgi:hypothetical protein